MLENINKQAGRKEDNKEEEKKPKMSEEEREKKKLELLTKCKGKKGITCKQANEIFNAAEIKNMPHITQEKKETPTDINKNETEEKMPELETVPKTEEIN